MKPEAPKTWPPIVTDGKLPPAMVWRDRVLTVGMWLLLFWLARHELYALWDISGAMVADGRLYFTGWQGKWAQLHPYLVAIGVLAIWELIWACVTLWRRKHYSRQPHPEPLTPQEEAGRIHCAPADLEAWRAFKVSVVDLDRDGTLHFRNVAGAAMPDEPNI